MYQMTSKTERCKINAQSSKKFMNYVPILSFVFFRTFQFLRSFGTFWPLKIPIYGLSTQNCLLVITIYDKYCVKTKFRWKKWLQLNLQVWLSVAAFLALMALEFQIKLKSCKLLPYEPNYTKKFWKFDFHKCLAFALTFMTFIGLFEFFWDPWSLGSPGVCPISISKHYIIKKS